ncbi:hypothetical protein [Brachybacterium sp. J153]|uniref:hypothetical protein n=1 Tax=Brachybacterium sp. J153 TaxID=3116488 RepID=UPI002E77A2E6|nr:hypothetical protein [Brachybacterium sp. J153]MEE1617311.1 hypothetical protein [Brachybacterium sp. J153]
MNSSIENMIRAELERMGVKTDDDEQQDTPEQPQQGAVPRVRVEEALSAAIGNRPTVSPTALNADRRLAAIFGADTLEGKPFK